MGWVFKILTTIILIFHAAGTVCANVAPPPVDPARVLLQIPFGIQNNGDRHGSGLVVPGSSAASFIIVESFHEKELSAELTIEIPKPLKPETEAGWFEISETPDSYILGARFELMTEFDDWHSLFTLGIPATARPGHYTIRARAGFSSKEGQKECEIRQQAVIRVATRTEIQKVFTVNQIKIPADLDGNYDNKLSRNSLVLPTDLGLLGKLLKSRGDIGAAPVSFASIQMENQADEAAIVHVSWEVWDPETGKEIKGFRISREFLDLHGGGDDRIQTQVFIPGKSKVQFVLPIFADKDLVLPGRYTGRIQTRLFGSDVTIRTDAFELVVKKMDWTSIGIMMYAIILTLGISGFLVFGNRLIFSRFKTRWLILIALFGSAKFLLSLVPKFFLTDLFNGLLGPFAVFATGVFREGLTYLFIMALVVLIPFPGVVTLSVLMSLTLFCLLGSFNPVVILFMMVSMSTMEVTLYLTGFTRQHAPNFTRTNKALFLAAFGMGIASAFAIFVDYNLYMLLYRLYYANWYIWANIIVVGFLYTAIFAPAGVMLGNKLKRTAIE
ncbi:hypothetical protein JCM12294_33190 [Desulfocicer niacini]